ncbi:serine/threonine-protein kinase [Dictyobacter aurantiacus]|uniref:Protein kinase domain-containing protein n=1 Tax=Dictyobacter aurantiacus TaxID=1936993 RepID=A0A401ZMD5_9CHLR|nr:serine/threonine-protein kinase [Dictyobacter aurantiacus]GCE08008.1 hypothetical protein KDAU_53370 [Dictyobacter aurantiacus]
MVDQSLLIGRQLGNYRMEGLIGQSSISDIYRGTYIQGHRQAVIKLWHLQLNDSEWQIFRREVQQLFQLDHKYILRIRDAEREHGVPLLVMDDIANTTLRQRLKDGQQLPLSIVVTYIKQLAEAIQYIHDHRLAHLNIKPENMLLDGQNNVILSDMRISTIVRNLAARNHPIPMSNVLYMAPELFMNQPHITSDQYALAAVAYEWLCGRPPFHGAYNTIIEKHRLQSPPSLLDQMQALPEEVERTLFTALAKDPTRRFPRIIDFANALEQASYQKPQVRGTVKVSREANPVASQAPRTGTTNPQPVRPSSSGLRPKLNLTSTAQSIGPFCTLREPVMSLDWSADGKHIVAAADGRNVSIWDIATRQMVKTYQRHRGKVQMVAWGPQKTSVTVASASSEGNIQVWNTNSGMQLASWLEDAPIRYFAWSPDGQFIVSINMAGNNIKIWDVKTGRLVVQYNSKIQQLQALDWSTDGTYIVAASKEGSMQMWFVGTGMDGDRESLKREQTRVYQQTAVNAINALDWSPNKKLLAYGGANNSVDIWNPITGISPVHYDQHKGPITAIQWSPDGSAIASASADRSVHVWDASNGKAIYSYRGHGDAVNAVKWSPDGKLLASGSSDRSIHIWSPS